MVYRSLVPLFVVLVLISGREGGGRGVLGKLFQSACTSPTRTFKHCALYLLLLSLCIDNNIEGGGGRHPMSGEGRLPI